MDGGDSDVERIFRRACRDEISRKKTIRQVDGFERQIQDCEALKLSQPPRGSLRIPLSGFVNNEDGGKEVEPVPMLSPPLIREFLMGRGEVVAAPACRQIARDRGFDVDLRLHPTPL